MIPIVTKPNDRCSSQTEPLSSAWRCAALPWIAVLLVGCHSRDQFQFDPEWASYQPFVQQIEYPDALPVYGSEDLLQTQRPTSVRNYQETEPWPITLEEATELALQNSEVIRDLGGLVVTSPAAARTVYDPALQELDPRNGVEAALSAFDAQFATSLILNQNERKFNNFFFGGGAAQFLQNTAAFNAEIAKTSATGTRYAFRNITDNDRNTVFVNRFASVYDTVFELEVRHPLMQGAGVEFNRIAGPNATPGNYNGVVLARLNTDVTLASFEASVRDLVRDVETAYWGLYFAYRDLDAKKQARNWARVIWQKQQQRIDAGRGRRDDEALARQQYYEFQARLENSLSGTTAGGVGLLTAERTLRRLLGLPPVDGKLLRPATEPFMAEIAFDWNDALDQALTRRVELRQQHWSIRRSELEVIAAENLRRPRLDIVARYGWRGFGDDLFGDPGTPEGSAFRDLYGGDLQEWQLGVEFTTPIGNRIGHLAVRHAELKLAREKAVLREQERHIAHELAAAFTELDRAYAVTRSAFNSLSAAMEQISLLELREGITEGPFFLLDAQNRATDSAVAYHRSVMDYNLALLSLEYVRGTLLDDMRVSLAEGPWSEYAHYAAAKQSRRFREAAGNYVIEESRVQSPESRVQSRESRVQSPESRVESRESRVQSPVPEKTISLLISSIAFTQR
ncbi:MAG: TolC family protein [Pirellulaceae bacterium]